MRRPARRGGSERADEGSVVLALLVAFLVLSMVGLIGATAVAGQKGVKLDRDFTFALHAADAGVSQGAFRIAAGRQLPSRIPATGTIAGTLAAGGSFAWYAQRTGNTREWQVVSRGTYRSKSRRVVATYKENRLFWTSAFADVSATFNGGNLADSYHSGPAASLRRLPGPGRTGLVGSNGDVKFLGSSTTVDGVQLWDYAPPNATGSRCSGQGTVGLAPSLQVCSDVARTLPVTGTPYQERLVERRELNPSPTDLSERVARCGSGPYPDLNIIGNASGDAMPAPMTATIGQNNRTATAFGPMTTGYYCVKNLNISTNVTLHSTASRDNPVVLYVTGNVKLTGAGLRVNCSPCSASKDSAPDAGALQIYMLGSGTMSTAPSSKLGMAVYGPQATCGGGSQNEIYGSLVCAKIDNVGGWSFHYDEALTAIGNTVFTQIKYQET